MPATLLLAGVVLFCLVLIFAAAYLLKGIKIALIATGAAFVLAAVLYVGMITLIVGSM